MLRQMPTLLLFKKLLNYNKGRTLLGLGFYDYLWQYSSFAHMHFCLGIEGVVFSLENSRCLRMY